MERIYQFLQDAGVYYLATTEGDQCICEWSMDPYCRRAGRR